MRLFLGLFPDAAVQRAIADAAGRLQNGALAAEALRWTREEQLHVTVRFLGDVESGVLERLRASLHGLVAGERDFGLETAGLGAFPRPERARVLFAALGAGDEELRALGARVEACVQAAGLPAEPRALHPHLTLARARRAPCALPELGRLPFPALAWRARALRLVSSEPAAQGRRYVAVEDFPLGT